MKLKPKKSDTVIFADLGDPELKKLFQLKLIKDGMQAKDVIKELVKQYVKNGKL